MKLRTRLIELKKERSQLIDYLRSDDILTANDVIKIAAEITRITKYVIKIETTEMKFSEKPCDDYFIQLPSKINQKRAIRDKKTKKMPVINSTWSTHT